MGKLKYIVIGLVFLIAAIAAIVIYRLYFLFDSKKVKAAAEAKANETAAPNEAYKYIIEMVESLKKSQDMIACIRLTAKMEGITKEQALVNAAVYKCYSYGFIAPPSPDGSVTQTATDFSTSDASAVAQ